MNKSQAGGYIFESVIWNFLRNSGYIRVQGRQIKGRGATHQIDASGLLGIPTPFISPIRLICEAKFQKGKIGLPEIRNFVGVYKDISENYFIKGTKSKYKTRYTDSACMFSKSPFSENAQNYAWAHNIFLVSFDKISALRPIISQINTFLENFGDNEINLEKEQLIKQFVSSNSARTRERNVVSLVVGILNQRYPIILAGDGDFLEYLHRKGETKNDVLRATKNFRESSNLDTLFGLGIEEAGKDPHQIRFSVPSGIAKNLIPQIDSRGPGEIVLKIDIPFLARVGRNLTRRIYEIQAHLPTSNY